MVTIVEPEIDDLNLIFDHDDHDDSSIQEMIRSTSGILATLDKLTTEIEEDLVSADGTPSITGSNESPGNDDDYDDDYYSDYEDGVSYSDEEDPDSGETKLFSMMDELVAELQIQLEEESDDEDSTSFDGDGSNNQSEGDKIEHTSMAETVEDEKKEGDRVEEQAELHQHVKTLLQQVTGMKTLFILDKTIHARNKNHHKISGNIQKKIELGEYDTDRLEHLMGAIASHANTDTTKPRHYVKIKKKKRKQRTNKHKKRKPRASVQTTQSLHILHDSLLALEEKLSRGD
mmetsp:Transcript_9701/g.28898  ORF Transcript_9701/g.28898 Transcript_9701/m.28898 type:complete len:288 (+) Transcript_9701:101-964(+)|eukprot:CAMPEP_0172359840 /NCGR_PEP_ID=MMETSP1060-20121228/3967_1 /TAXON_ID=37318 /ORGANISM="Pseudo-nitzschia pungens, Strain cf. cingulata" /LENGTH=287 /DNA_ID=CAMNT_0013081639 /DNA_START=67 /DNA_END=930 /DNA_ORIENTATION=+